MRSKHIALLLSLALTPLALAQRHDANRPDPKHSRERSHLGHEREVLQVLNVQREALAPKLSSVPLCPCNHGEDRLSCLAMHGW